MRPWSRPSTRPSPGPSWRGESNGLPLDVFIAGDDAAANASVGSFVAAGGMRPLVVGPLKRCPRTRGLPVCPHDPCRPTRSSPTSTGTPGSRSPARHHPGPGRRSPPSNAAGGLRRFSSSRDRKAGRGCTLRNCRRPLVGCLHRQRGYRRPAADSSASRRSASHPAEAQRGLTCTVPSSLRTCCAGWRRRRPASPRRRPGRQEGPAARQELPGVPRRARHRLLPRACASPSRARPSGPSTTPNPWRSCPAAWSARRGNRPPAIAAADEAYDGLGTPTGSTRRPSAATPSTATDSRSMPRSTTANATTTPSGTASRWSSATVTARSSTGSRSP